MNEKRRNFVSAIVIVLLGVTGAITTTRAAAGALPAAPASAAQTQSVAKKIGTIKAINGNVITLAPDSGAEITVTVQPTAKILQLAPGEKDLKNTTPIQLQDLHVGDTIRVRGFAADNATSIPALEVIVITHSAMAAVSDQIRQDWQKRGMGGLVDSVDAPNGTVTVSISSVGGKKTIVVRTTKSTVVRRYAPDSVKFEDAKPSTLQEIRQGDQLRARGDRNADGSEFTAEEVVTGTFPFVVGTVKSVDASAGRLSVQDILTKKTVEVKTAPDSQLHKIPPEMAQRFAARLKGGMPPGTPGASSSAASSQAGAGGAQSPQAANSGAIRPNGGTGAGAPAGGGNGGPANGGAGNGRAPDLQQLLSRLPSSTLADLHLQKGDAVVVLATQGTGSTPSTAITLLSGVEPILQAAPNATQAMMLTPWSLGGAPGGDAGTQ
jgi:hypothetical protein